MVNRWRGEVGLQVNGEGCVMRLSLGALAELEERIGAAGLLELVQRFESSAFTAQDLSDLLFAGLSCGGWSGSHEDLKRAHISGGAEAAVRAAAQLLKVTFSAEP
ncbi:MAG: gene transfer agent family protein [Pseudomonadota bacterium]